MTVPALVVGYGSIGARHARLLVDLGHEVSCVTRNESCPFPRFETIADAVQNTSPHLVIIANATADHLRSLQTLVDLDFAAKVLIEKPLSGGFASAIEIGKMSVAIAYNLRFHPLVDQLKQFMTGSRLVSARFQAGQFLPDWRPGTDYRNSYSANRAAGGGVLRDLSHELDLALWFGGPWLRVAALLGRSGGLSIETEDTASLLVETTGGASMSIAVDYLNRTPRRSIDMVAMRDGAVISASLDLVRGTLSLPGGEVVTATPERDSTYIAQLKSVLGTTSTVSCSYAEGLAVDRLILAAEAASAKGVWVHNESV